MGHQRGGNHGAHSDDRADGQVNVAGDQHITLSDADDEVGRDLAARARKAAQNITEAVRMTVDPEVSVVKLFFGHVFRFQIYRQVQQIVH